MLVLNDEFLFYLSEIICINMFIQVIFLLKLL